jgi:hypothetical protein
VRRVYVFFGVDVGGRYSAGSSPLKATSAEKEGNRRAAPEEPAA